MTIKNKYLKIGIVPTDIFTDLCTPNTQIMKILYTLLFIQMGWILPLSAQKQDSIYIGTRHSLFSEILNEERSFWIYVPETKLETKEKSYPVLYLLDGDSFFHSVVGFTRFFSSSKISNLPPCIIVAVLNTDRTRDFTPTCSAARRDGSIHPNDEPTGGGAGQFHRFLIEELRPEVEEKTPANGTNFLVGHSYAGLFTLQTLFDHPESFDTYISIDPSLWWDRGIFLQQAEKNVYQKDFSGKQLYVAFATHQRPKVKLVQFSLADSLKEQIIPEMKNKHLRVIYRKFPDEVHGTIALPAIFDGLKSLFRN